MKIEELEKLFPNMIFPYEYPKPFPAEIVNPRSIKAIVLGCDPSNVSKREGSTKELETVFGIEGKVKDKRYFCRILRNLEQVGLSLENIYVQNLCRNYFTKETNKNPIWYEAARYWVNSLKKELEDLKIPVKIPVFLTSKYLYKASIRKNNERKEFDEYYKNPELIPISKDENYIERPLIPLYRGRANYYNLTNWKGYKEKVIQVLIDNSNLMITNE